MSLYKKEEIWDSEEDIVKTEAEIEIMWPQAKGHLEALEAGRDKEGFTPRTLRGSMPLP